MRESLGFPKPKGAMKVKAASGFAQAGSRRVRRAHCRPVPTALSAGRRKSVHVGTRKMVNYA